MARIPFNNNVILTFKRSELLDDLRTIAFVEADVMENETHGKHQTFDIAEDGNIDRVTRLMRLAVAECREFLLPFSKAPVSAEETANDILVENEIYTINLAVPKTFSKTTVELVEGYIHEYILCRILAEFLAVTKPEAASLYLAKAKDSQREIESAKSTRATRTRRGLSPF